jgi:hypothetical protein
VRERSGATTAFYNYNDSEKSEMMLCFGQDQIRSKIIADNKCLQVKNLKYIGCEISYEDGKDIQQKLSKICSNAWNS